MHIFPLTIESKWVTELTICAQKMICANHRDALRFKLTEVTVQHCDYSHCNLNKKRLDCDVIPVSSA